LTQIKTVPVHLGNGIWGCIAVGLFAEPSRVANAYSDHGHYGLFYGTGGNLLGAQVVGILWIIGWVTLITTPYFLFLHFLGLFRVDLLEEEVGMDIFHHKGAAYDMSGPPEDAIARFDDSRHRKHDAVHPSCPPKNKVDKTDATRVELGENEDEKTDKADQRIYTIVVEP
jgi:hypothetical protein